MNGAVAPQRIDIDALPAQRWKNGAGLTRELAVGPVGAGPDDFDWRLSVAEVEHDAPFSAFAGVDRCIGLLRGAGMDLVSSEGAVVHSLQPLRPWSFDGARPLTARLAATACRDFNVMTRHGRWRADVRVLHGAAALASGQVTLLLCVAGTWQAGSDTLAPMRALLWRGLDAPITVAPKADAAGAALLHVRLCHDPFR